MHHLTVVQIWVHVHIVRDEPRVDPTCNIHSVVGRAGDRPGECVVEDSIGHVHEGTPVIDRVGIRAGLAIVPVVRTCYPNCVRNEERTGIHVAFSVA